MKLRSAAPVIVFYVLIVCIFIASTYLASETTSVIAQKIPLPRAHTIVIDAGHGGEDGGATSCTGKLESAFNLEISLRLNDLFHFLGYQTIMVRTTDRSVYTQGETIASKKVSDLKQRVNLVNGMDNALLISIHQNTFSDSRYSGAQVFYAPKGEGKQLASVLQTAFCETLNPTSNRKSKKAEGIYLMDHIECTGILVECGFLSNPEEEAKLRDETYQKRICAVITATTTNFLDR